MEENEKLYNDEKEEICEEEEEKTGFDPYLAILIMQISVCVIAILTVLVLKFGFKEFYKPFKEFYDQNVKVETDINLVLGEK